MEAKVNQYYFVYFLESMKNGKIYVGFTEKSPVERLSEHNKGLNKWTKHNRPFKLVYYEKYCCEKDGRRRELFYKSGFGKLIKDIIVRVVKEKHIDALKNIRNGA